MKQQRAREMGITIGTLPTGPRNKITDVPGVRVGHSTVRDEKHKTGVTVILPCEDNVFLNKPVAAAFVHNGYGKTCGTVQIDELGTLETPIALTNTLNVGAVSDAIVQYMVKRCAQDGHSLRSVNPIVGECNDAALNTITDRPITAEHVFEAIDTATEDFAEGDVGAGTGTTCYGYKGGIGSASRKITLGGKDYTLGVLVQSNYGAMQDLRINGKAPTALHDPEPPCDKGSIMIILATDIPLTARQLKRVVKRCSIGIARLGSYIGHGSGEIFIGFTTANRIPVQATDILSLSAISEDRIDLLFRAAGEASEEAILNSMLCADAAVTLDGKALPSLRDVIQP
ncbi:MAG: P1 family peptidase [Clostridia bacterium]|nr:P1 family peptidase [Clostridia bacterium]